MRQAALTTLAPKRTRSIFLALSALALLATAHAESPAKQSLNIVFVGDSITEAVGDSYTPRDKKFAPPIYVSQYLLKQPGIAKVNFSNQGHSGFTTVNFLPSQGDTFKAVEQAADDLQKQNAASLIFSVSLGTNDSAIDGPLGSPVSPADYGKNMTTIADRLLKDYPECKIIFHHPTWYSPNTHNGARYLAGGLARLQNYFPVIDAVAMAENKTHPGQIFIGDTKAFTFFKKNHLAYLIPEQGQAGTFYLHPNKKGSEILAEFWGKAIYKSIRKKSTASKSDTINK